MQLNNSTVIDRHNRPTVIQPVGLRVLFINDGVFQDPYQISGVTILSKNANISNAALESGGSQEGLLASSLTDSDVLMHFANSATLTTDSAFDVANYTPGAQASGIFKVAAGEYMVVLDGRYSLSGAYGFHGSAVEVANTASASDDYIDVWTVKSAEASLLKTVIHDFELFADTFLTVTQPLLLRPTNRLTNKHEKLGSKIDLKITTEVSVENKDIDSSVKNIFKSSVITDPQVEIVKLNEDVSLASRVTVSSFADSSGLVDVTSDNTIIFNWDTESLKTKTEVGDGTFGSLTGTYTVQGKFNMLNQRFLTPLFHLILK